MSNQPYNVLRRRAAEYLRYSSDNQNDATISAQDRIVKAFAEQEDYTIVATYVDEAETATTSDNRDNFLQMLSDAKKGMFDYIIVWQFSRFARNKEESVIYKAMLRKVGVRVISATEKTDDTPSGKLLEGMLEVLNQYFSDNLSVEVRKGKKENVLTGKHAGGSLPFGIYKEEETGIFKINETQAKSIRLIFELYLQGYGCRRIASILQEKGHKPPKGDEWNGGSVRQMLNNEAYIGIYDYTLGKGTSVEENFKLDNVYPPIIDDKTWALSRKVKKDKNKAPKRAERNRLYILTGKTVCGCCGKNYVGYSSGRKDANGNKYYYYKCNGKSDKAKHATSCKNKDIRAERLEAWVLDMIAKHILSDKAIYTILDSVEKKLKEKNKASGGNVKKLEKEAAELDARIEHYLDLYDEKKLSKARLTKRTELLEKQLASVHLELEQLRNLNSVNVDIEALKKFLYHYRDNMDNMTEETKKALVDTFVHKIVITSDDIQLTLKVDDTLEDTLNFSGGVSDMAIAAVAPKHIYEKMVQEKVEVVTALDTPDIPKRKLSDTIRNIKRREYYKQKGK